MGETDNNPLLHQSPKDEPRRFFLARGTGLLAASFLIFYLVALLSLTTSSPWSTPSASPLRPLCATAPPAPDHTDMNPRAAATSPAASRGCRIFHNDGMWTRNHTSWEPLGSAASGDDHFRSTQRPRHVLLAGDSTLARLNANLPLEALHPGQRPHTLKTAGRCTLLEYYGLARAERWVAPDLTVEGPTAYGLNNSFCTDCSGCNAMLRTVTEESTSETWSYEYLPIEFARDREFPTGTGAATSQQAAAEYLRATYPRDLCVLSAGIHDVILNITAARFAENVLEYLGLMAPFCEKVIWLLPSASLNGRPQTHEALLGLRHELRVRCGRMGSNVLLFEIWDMSLPRELHTDNVHHSNPYYASLARLLLPLELQGI